ncbi:MAG: 50S ribosomal protein L6 [Elusimicrobiota bacterium]|jgi:large subunit ribosomal protein L6
MSRLGRKPIPIPEKVKVSIAGSVVTAEGPLGRLTRNLPVGISAKVDGSTLLVTRADDSNRQKALHGTLRKVVLNMVEGVSAGFTKNLQIEGVGFRAQSAGEKITMQLGYSHPVEFVVPKGIKVTVDPKQTFLSVQGFDRELVGQVAANIRRLKPPEPYKGTGIRYQNEHIRRKAGKAAVGAGGGAGGAKK